MACTQSPAFNLKRGATLDILARIPSAFADGHFADWTPTSQVSDAKGATIATLAVQWSDPATTRTLRLQAADTTGWPIGPAEFDICLTSPTGVRLYTTTTYFHVVRESTRV